jgi:osmotically-inducible protein OsmY
MDNNNSIVEMHPSHTAAEAAILPVDAVAAEPTKELGQSKVARKGRSSTGRPAPGFGRWYAVLLILVGMQVVTSQAFGAATRKRQITNSGITAAVEEALLFEKGVSPDDVDVSTNQGIVTLSGSVSNLLAKERAARIAESIRGVLGTINRITVTPVSRSDAEIRKDILAALRQDPATESYRIAVSVQNAVATLNGSVASHTEEHMAARLAKGVRGLKDVQSNIVLNYASKRTDSEIAADVKARLQWDVWLNGDAIDAVVKGGKVTLSGVVGSAREKSRAFDDGWVNGVVSVDNTRVEVSPLAQNGAHRKAKWAVKSDSEIKRAVQAALRLDPRVSAFSPEVTVEGGEIILSGSVGNLKAKFCAGQDARDIAGVWGVDNLLKVRPSGESKDAEIKNQLKAALSWDGLLDGARIDVAVVDGAVDLSGTVGSDSERAEAQDVASRTKGVRLVRNHLKADPDFEFSYYALPEHDSLYAGLHDVPPYSDDSSAPVPRPYLNDERIKEKIERTLFWSPLVHTDDIKVAVAGGVATLTGSVETWIGWGEAEKAARKSGATSVVNRVTVKRGAWLWW